MQLISWPKYLKVTVVNQLTDGRFGSSLAGDREVSCYRGYVGVCHFTTEIHKGRVGELYIISKET